MKKIKFIVALLVCCSVPIFAGCDKKHEHSLELVPVVNSSCEIEGNIEYYKCTGCLKSFEDELAKKEILLESTIVDAIGHEYVNETQNIDCVKICMNCNDRKVSHNYSSQLNALVQSHDAIENCGSFKCLNCDDLEYKTVNFEDVGVPILNFYGSMDGISKENKINISVSYKSESVNFDCDATLKLQGASSLSFSKKNYNITFLKSGTTKKNKVCLFEDWGAQSKYTLKANWIDFSHARNVVSGKIYNQIVKARDLEDELSEVNTGGVVDGFPILIYINGDFEGLYTLNIPKDGWMFGMEEDEDGNGELKQAALSMGSWADEVFFNKQVESFSDSVELEFCSTEDTIGTDWVLESFNDMIDFVLNSSDDEFKTNISNYVNVDRTIDSLLYTSFIMAGDNIAKNINWLTYDGVHWFSSMYDMDGTWGLRYDGQLAFQPTDIIVNEEIGNRLWCRIYKLLRDDVVRRYFELRLSVLTYDNIKNEFEMFDNSISQLIRKTEIEKWSNIPSVNTNNIEQILDFASKRLEYMDNTMLELI